VDVVSADREGIGSSLSLRRAVILLGPPGAGKGTQAPRIAQRYHLPHLSTGDMFRDQIARETELGRKAKPLVDRGELVPDEIVLDMVAERITHADCANGFVFDGFPRTLQQAEGLERICSSQEFGVSIVLFIVVQPDSLLRRLTGRRICKAGGHIYNIYSQPPKQEGVCDIDGSELIHRTDDTEPVIRIRLAAYEKRTRPLVEYYSQRGLLTTVDGVDDADVVTTNVMKILAEAERPK
jgi:adenylate kinase